MTSISLEGEREEGLVVDGQAEGEQGNRAQGLVIEEAEEDGHMCVMDGGRGAPGRG